MPAFMVQDLRVNGGVGGASCRAHPTPSLVLWCSAAQQSALAADLCWLRLEGDHRHLIQHLFARATDQAAKLTGLDLGRLAYVARCLGRMPERQMQVGWRHRCPRMSAICSYRVMTCDDMQCPLTQASNLHVSHPHRSLLCCQSCLLRMGLVMHI